MTQIKNCPFRVKTTIEIKNVKLTNDNNGIFRCKFPLTSEPVLSDVGLVFLRSIVILTPNGNFWVVPLLHSVSDMYMLCATALR